MPFRKELRQRDVRLILTRMITPVRQILERADRKHEIGPQDLVHSPAEAFLDYVVSETGDSSGRGLIRAGLLEARDVLQARMSAVHAERQATLAAILDNLDKEIQQIEGE
jgi:hypothetical protein